MNPPETHSFFVFGQIVSNKIWQNLSGLIFSVKLQTSIINLGLNTYITISFVWKSFRFFLYKEISLIIF